MCLASAGLLVGCAATIPTELIDARHAYQKASAGPAAELTPADLHTADEALSKAEKSFASHPKSYRTRDLAYVAERKANLAEASAAIAAAQGNAAQANLKFQTTQGKIMKQTKQDLSRARTDIDQYEHDAEMAAGKLTAAQQAQIDADKRFAVTKTAAEERLFVEQQARLDAEDRSAEAQAALVDLAAVKEEARGLVITLAGSVLFASNHATLLPAAQVRLNQVAKTLMATNERRLTVEGYTDSQGSAAYNMDLSQRRADAVRAYLIAQDYPADRVQARGMGEVRPVADNASPEGRANNRRVEIVVDREVSQNE
jgi:outer membrane protein OmpA-like peptidoglycan-associated protein